MESMNYKINGFCLFECRVNITLICEIYLLGTDKEKAVLTPQTKEYNKFGQECVEVGCSVDLFLFNNAYIDVATLSQVQFQ